jgi:hypothetical protein
MLDALNTKARLDGRLGIRKRCLLQIPPARKEGFDQAQLMVVTGKNKTFSSCAPQQDTSWWLKPVILAIQEAAIRKMVVQSQPTQIVHETLSRKYPAHTHTHTHTRKKNKTQSFGKLAMYAHG